MYEIEASIARVSMRYERSAGVHVQNVVVKFNSICLPVLSSTDSLVSTNARTIHGALHSTVRY